jgi:hypothetical protein
MDIIRFTKTGLDKTKLQNAEIVNGIERKMWVERYRNNCEFEFIAPVSSGLSGVLPIGSFVSHTDTAEVMIVENHEITSNPDNDSTLRITGRSYETYLENRIVGGNFAAQEAEAYGIFNNYETSITTTPNNCIRLIDEHITADLLYFDDDELPYVFTKIDIDFDTFDGVADRRTLEFGTVYERLLELLEIDNLGIRVERPGPHAYGWFKRNPAVWGTPPLEEKTAFMIHNGHNKFYDVIFSNDAGDIVSADYLWSNKHRKTAAIVFNKWARVMTFSKPDIKYKRRFQYVNSSDLEEEYPEMPTGAALTTLFEKMHERGKKVLATKKSVNITKVELAKDSTRYKYRTDYELGDLVGVRGEYGTVAAMRVVEHVEIEDENGTQAYPTLAIDDPEEVD